MKIICKKSDLLNRVNIALKAVSTKSTLPILECIVIEVKSNQIKLIANDMELGIETLVQGEILEEGIIALNAKIFSEIIRKLPDNDITIETDANYTAHITCEKAKFNIAGKSDEEFPTLPIIERDNFITLSQFSLKEIIRQTVFSISDNESNKIMTGELFEINQNEFKVVSLDGHRISIRKIQLKEEYNHIKVIVPGKTLNEISKILSGEIEDEVKIFFTNKHIVFEFDNTMVLSRLIEGEYYKIDQMLSSDYETKITINKKEFLSCIDRATLLIKESEKKPIIINIGDSSMELKINSTIGSMKEEIDIHKEGKDILIGFNPKFLIDALRVIDEEEVDIYLFNPKAPCFIKDKEETYIYLILPVNFNAGVN
ncbi:DNA polymerase III subunit beta [Velocimicrobium porci]|uniref:Beta sliding clamp n=1 Tax=Velocimicrobium porci TaxID=2606634 RepID=A0A6L5XWQ8_9FIRM|nr:DNA polymerase III subunit beta [Velocimicrobium porci]MSS62967.1 DNA polymerase III subunit beta [Velocimicrobium porci]